MTEAPAGTSSQTGGWARLLGVWLVLGAVAWFLVAFARRSGGELDAHTFFSEWCAARPERVALGDARIDSSGVRVLELEVGASGTPVPGEPSRLVLWEAADAGPVLAAWTGFPNYEAPESEEPTDPAPKEFGQPKSKWREVQRGDISYGRWTSTYVRLRRVAPGEPDLDQVRVNITDRRRYALLIAEWEPGVAAMLPALERLLAELELKAELADRPPPAR
ncbi:MAG: hypothetical protein FJ299_02035 [Planctomycetes bacterium]|nr:hypothetical protein [Planctomycetota bacterium]